MSLLMLFVPTVGLENIYLTHLLLYSQHSLYLPVVSSGVVNILKTTLVLSIQK